MCALASDQNLSGVVASVGATFRRWSAGVARRRRVTARRARALDLGPPAARPRGSGGRRRSCVAGVGGTAARGGMANETVLVELGPPSGPGGAPPRLEPTFPDYDLTPQAAVQNDGAACGVPAPAPPSSSTIRATWAHLPCLCRGCTGTSQDSTFLRSLRAATPAQRSAPSTTGSLEALAAIHAVPWRGTALRNRCRTGLDALFARWKTYVLLGGRGRPAACAGRGARVVRPSPAAERSPLCSGRRTPRQPRLRP